MPENKVDLLRGVAHRVNVEGRSGSWMGARECLCVATDEEQYQITAGEFRLGQPIDHAHHVHGRELTVLVPLQGGFPLRGGVSGGRVKTAIGPHVRQ